MKPRLLVAPFALTFLILLGAAPVSASCEDGSTPAYFNLQVNSPYGGSCTLYFGGSVPLITVSVQLYSVPFQKARFSLPDPPWGTVLGESWNATVVGDRHTGMEIDFGDCSGPVTLGTLTLYVDPAIVGPCMPWQVDDGCEMEDCDGVTRAATATPYQVTTTVFDCGCCFQCCQSLPPYDLFPADGATDVPTNVELSWTGTPDDLDQGLDHYCYVLIGTDPACNTGQLIKTDCVLDTFSPDFLEPETTYYWAAGWNAVTGSGCSSGAFGISPIHSFTTGGPLPVAQATWGQVKAMYRE